MRRSKHMRGAALAFSILASLIVSGCAVYPLPDGARTHVTSTVSMLNNEGIVVHVLNYSNVSQTTRARIYENTGAGAVQVADSGDVQMPPMWQWSLGYTVKKSSEYWIELDVSSEKLVPKASFERHDGNKWVPFVTYAPGDFSSFDPQGRRLW